MSDRDKTSSTRGPHPQPGSRDEHIVKRINDRHRYGAVPTNPKAAEASRRPERSPAPPVELDTTRRKRDGKR
jgi:hypothetical protein